MKFPRNCKKFNELFLDEEGEAGPIKATGKRIHKISGTENDRCIYADVNMMKRYLRKRIGDPWNDVQSDFLSRFDSRTFEGHTVREWLTDYTVETKCMIEEDGTVTDKRGMKLGGWWEEFYVHPDSQTLELAPCTRSKYRNETPQKVFELNGILYHEHEGLWYRVKMKEINKTRTWWGYGYEFLSLHPSDAFLTFDYFNRCRRSEAYVFRGKYGLSPEGKAWYCIWKQSANSKEIAHLKSKYFGREAA